MEFLLIYRVVANGMGRNPLERAGTVLSLALGAQPGGCVGQACGDRSLKTQIPLRIGDIGMARPIYRP